MSLVSIYVLLYLIQREQVLDLVELSSLNAVKRAMVRYGASASAVPKRYLSFGPRWADSCKVLTNSFAIFRLVQLFNIIYG